MRDWYHAMRLRIFKHAFVSPFEMMEMLMLVNAEKEPMFKIRVGVAGVNNGLGKYATLNIIEESAQTKIESQRQEYDKAAAYLLNEVYSARIAQPTLAYLKQNTFREEFQENDLMSDWMYTSINQIIFAGPFGATEALSPTFDCQQAL